MHKYIILSFCAAAMLTMASCQQPAPAAAPDNQTAAPVSYGKNLPIAYVDIDSLLTNYNLARDLNEEMLTRQENARASVNEKGRKLEKEMAEFERKVKNNAFLSQDRFEQEQQRLLKQQQELQTYAQQLENELLQEQQKMLTQVTDSITNFIKEYNKDGKYEAIFNKNSTLFINPAYNITGEIITLLNKRYSKISKK